MDNFSDGSIFCSFVNESMKRVDKKLLPAALLVEDGRRSVPSARSISSATSAGGRHLLTRGTVDKSDAKSVLFRKQGALRRSNIAVASGAVYAPPDTDSIRHRAKMVLIGALESLRLHEDIPSWRVQQMTLEEVAQLLRDKTESNNSKDVTSTIFLGVGGLKAIQLQLYYRKKPTATGTRAVIGLSLRAVAMIQALFRGYATRKIHQPKLQELHNTLQQQQQQQQLCKNCLAGANGSALELERLLDEAHHTIETSETARLAAEREVGTLKSAQARLQAEMDADRAVRQAMLNEAARTTAGMARLQSECAAAAEREGELTRRIAAAQREASQLKEALEKQQHDAHLAKEALDEQQREKQRLKEALDEQQRETQLVKEALDEQLCEARLAKEALEEEVGQLKATAYSLVAELSAAVRDTTNLHADVMCLQGRLDKTVSEMDHAEREATLRVQQVETAQSELRTCAQERDRLQAELEQARAESDAAAKLAAQDASQRKCQLELLQAAHTSCVQERDESMSELAQVKEDLDLVKKAASNEAAKLRAALEQKKHEHDLLQAELDRSVRASEEAQVSLELARADADTERKTARADLAQQKHAADRLRHELETCASTRDELQAELDARIAADATLRAELGQRKQQLKLLQSELDRRTQDLSSVLVELDWVRAGSIDVEPARLARERALRALNARRTSPERVAVSPARLSLTSPTRRTEAATPNASAFRHGLGERSRVTKVHASASPAGGYDSDKELREHLDRALQHAGRESWLRRMRGEARDNLGMSEAEAGQWEQSHSNAMARLQQEHAEAIDSYRQASSRWLHNRS